MDIFLLKTPGLVGAPGAAFSLRAGMIFPGRHFLSGWPVRFRMDIFLLLLRGPWGRHGNWGCPGRCVISPGALFPGACTLRVGIYFPGGLWGFEWIFFVITPGPVGASRELGLPGAMHDLSGRFYSPGRHLLSG